MVSVNVDAKKLEDIITEKDCVLQELYPNIYRVFIGGQEVNWLVKVYKNIKFAKKEVDNLARLKNVSGVPKMLCFRLNTEFSFVVLSKFAGKDLREQEKVLSEKDLQIIARKLLLILGDIHRLGVVHKDIKPENVVYDRESGEVALIDFEEKHTAGFESPEYFLGRAGRKSDVWSLGIMIYELLRGKLPFKRGNESLILPSSWNSDLKDFLYCVLDRDVRTRYGVDDALNHIWIQ